MTDSLFSPVWYRVAQLKPRLRSHVRLHRHHYRDQIWHILQDPLSGRHHRFSPTAYFMIGLWDGAHSVQQVWDLAHEKLTDDAPSQDEMIRLLSQLHNADLLICDLPPDTEELFKRHQSQQRKEQKQRFRNPLALRIPLWDPDTFLQRGLPLVRPLFSWLGGAIWLAVVVTAAVLTGMHWPALTTNMIDRVLTPQNLLLLWLLYPVVKGLHEFGHGFATKLWGGEVHTMGIMFLVLAPVPYVDASSATAFASKRQRIVVGAVGIMTELFIAALALFVWINSELGLVRTLAYNTLLIGAVSTLFFNINPLLRFDGYYILTDLIEMPNLASRAQRYLGYLIQRYGFGVSDAQPPNVGPGERVWFVGYGIAAFVYRLLIMGVIILLVAGKFFIIGVLLALWATWTMLALPVYKQLVFLFTSPQLRRHRARAVVSSSLLFVLVTTILLGLPVPLTTHAEGVIWLPEHAQVRPQGEGVVQRFLAEPDTTVSSGQPLFALEDPLLPAEINVLEAQLQELKAQYTSEWRNERVKANITQKKMETVQADLARARERQQALIVRSPTAGQFIVPQAQDLIGRFLKQGELMAYVADFSHITVRSVVSQTAIGLIRQGTENIDVKLAERITDTLPAVITRSVPGATDRLPSPALGTQGGGQIPVDPNDSENVKTLVSVFQIDLKLPAATPISGLGGRVFVRFDHGKEPLAFQWYRQIRQLFLKRFGV
jgi:putative peptide zinc metalloprotease protein